VGLELHPERNLIVGPNGAGKTSLLESIHLLARGRSFRTRQTRRLIQEGRAGFRVVGVIGDGGPFTERIGVSFGGGGLEIEVGGRRAKGMTELAEALVVHVVDPSAHALIEGGPTVRRRFLDGGVFHVEHRYLETWRQYRRVLGQRNAALKSRAADAELAAWDRQLVAAGAVIDDARGRYVRALAGALSTVGQRLLGLEIGLEYRSGWRKGSELAAALEESRVRDRQTGFTQSGPHRADLLVRMDGHRVEQRASRGQQKLIAAGLVLAEAACLRDSGAQKGILLLDDPAAELDKGALQRLIGEVSRLPVQCVFTGIDPSALPIGDGALFHVEQGRVQAVV
jgi:DNA replication and repair protein RecF